MHLRPLNRFERERRGCAQAMAIAIPPQWLLAAMLLAIATAAEEWIAVFIAAGTRMLTPAGKRKLRGGKRRIANGTNNACCCATCAGACSDTPPGGYILTLSGVTTCNTACSVCGGVFGSHKVDSSTAFDGTYTLSFFEDCWWRHLDITGVGLGYGYSGGVCASLSATVDRVDINLFKLTGPNHFDLSVRIRQAVTGNYAALFTGFSGTLNTGTCSDAGGYSIANTNTCSACNGAASGGTATLTPA